MFSTSMVVETITIAVQIVIPTKRYSLKTDNCSENNTTAVRHDYYSISRIPFKQLYLKLKIFNHKKGKKV